MLSLLKTPLSSACLRLSAAILLGTSATTQTAAAIEPARSLMIDRFDYTASSSVEAVWQGASPSDSAPEVIEFEGESTVSLSTPFASLPEPPRFSIDRDVNLDLTSATSITLEVNLDQNAHAQVSVYFRSGKGWFSGAGYVTKPGWRKIIIEKESYSAEGAPAGWDKIDGVRIAIWPNKTGRHDSSIRLKSLQANWNNVAIIVPGEANANDDKNTQAIAERIVNILRETGIGADPISEDFLISGILGDRPLTILPCNNKIGPEALTVLKNYASDGGKLFLSYNLPESLAEVIGFEKGSYFGQENPGDFAAIQFNTEDIPGMPPKVGQGSWNIITAKPVAHNARVIGRWLNSDGKPTEKAAMLLSDRGAFLSHILLKDDPANKAAMLTALLGKLSPDLWKEAALNAHRNSSKIGHCGTENELEQFVGDGRGAGKLAESKFAMKQSAKLLEEGNAFESYEMAKAARQLKADAYLASHTSRPIEARAFWNHTGTGAYPGDWERTTHEMASAGMNMVLPNMLWGGQAHYPSDVLPRSKTFEKHGDQIEQCVEAGKKNGIEVHVWKVNFNLGHGIPQEYIDQLRKEDRLQVSVDGEPGDWLNPAHPENFKMELDSILEVVRNYDIDGFHFDYIRYPGSRNDFSDYSRRKFESDTGTTVENWPADCYDGPLKEAYSDWRCDNITRLVKTVSEEARKIRPDIKISAAVFRDYPNCRQWVAQDWPLWAKEGYVDFLCPMDYTDDDEQYTDWITKQKSQLPEGFPLYPGIGISLRNKTQSADRLVGQVFLNRKAGTGGFTIFDMKKSTLERVTRGLSLSAGSAKAVPPHRKAE